MHPAYGSAFTDSSMGVRDVLSIHPTASPSKEGVVCYTPILLDSPAVANNLFHFPHCESASTHINFCFYHAAHPGFTVVR